MIMHKCNYMYMYNYYLALHSDGGEGRSAGSGWWFVMSVVGRGKVKGGWHSKWKALRCDGKRKGLCKCARRVEGREWRGKEGGGGLAAAVTSSFMNSLYFCSVQNKRTFLLKKMKKEKKNKERLFVSSTSFVPSSSAFMFPRNHRCLK